MKSLSLHTKISHKTYFYQEEDDSLLDEILKLEMFEKDMSAASEFILFDIDKKEIIQEFESLENFSFKKFSPEVLAMKGLHPDFFSHIEMPKSVTCLVVDGGEYMLNLMKKSDVMIKIWESYLSIGNKARFASTLIERIQLEAEMRRILKNIENLALKSPIYALLYQTADSNISELALRWVYLSKKELDLLHRFENLEILDLKYNFNDDFSGSKLPANLKYLTISGTTIENLSEINWDGLKLQGLSLELNSIKDLSVLKQIPTTIQDLVLDNNLIENFLISDLPENLQFLSLKLNRLTNTFFEGQNSAALHSCVTELDLSNNQLKINNWFLCRIIETFPMLKYITLTGNEICGIPEDLLENNEESCNITKIKHWLELYEEQNDVGTYLELRHTFNYYDRGNTIILNWKHEMLPSKIILSDIKDQFEDYLGTMPEFKIFNDGLYCDIVHNKISIIIREDIGCTKGIILELYTADKNVLNSYFYKYFSQIKRLIELNTHHFILPLASFSDGCEIYKDFFDFIYHIDKKIKGNQVVLCNENSTMLLINFEPFSGKPIHVPIDSLAFIIKAGNNFFPFILDEDNFLCNYYKYYDEYFKIYVKEADKKMYSESIANKYLGNSCLVESFFQQTNNITSHTPVYYNSNYFIQQKGKLILKDFKVKLDLKRLTFPINDKKQLKINIDNDMIYLEGWYDPKKLKIIPLETS